jgi:NAD(P)H-flavin reductase
MKSNIYDETVIEKTKVVDEREIAVEEDTWSISHPGRHTITRKESLNEGVSLIEVKAPMISRRIKPGQFVIVRLHEKGERIPFTVFEKYEEKGLITIIFQKVGKSTFELDTYKEGDDILDVVGPLGNPIELRKYGTVVCIGGGVGVAELYPIIEAMKNAGNRIITIVGFKTKDLVICTDELSRYSDELYVCTDDGSFTQGLWGCKGFVSDALENMIYMNHQQDPFGGTGIGLVYAVGPLPMMKKLSEATRLYGLSIQVSLNPIMLDGTGMCGSCRVRIDDKVKFACVDGPCFDGHKVDFVELLQRQEMFRTQEKDALAKFDNGCFH